MEDLERQIPYSMEKTWSQIPGICPGGDVEVSNWSVHNILNFDLNKSRQKFLHSLKEHHKISNIPKFRCEML